MSSEQRILTAVPERFVGDCVIVRPFTDALVPPEMLATGQRSRQAAIRPTARRGRS